MQYLGKPSMVNGGYDAHGNFDLADAKRRFLALFW
jgi:hypothetical protein